MSKSWKPSTFSLVQFRDQFNCIYSASQAIRSWRLLLDLQFPNMHY
jgi:hypothetical protein